MSKLTAELKNAIKKEFLDHPSKSDRQIGKEFKISNVTISKYRNEINEHYDTDFIQTTAGKFIKAFGVATDYWMAQISELEDLKKSTHIMQSINKETGDIIEREVELSPMEVLAITKQQADLQAKILFLASQQEAITVINMMRNGQLSSIIN